MGKRMLNRWFRLAELGTDVRTEVLAGVTTFMTMAWVSALAGQGRRGRDSSAR